MSIAEKFEVIADAVYDKGVSYGKKSQYDEFWDTYQQNGNRQDYTYAFYGMVWDDEIYNPKYEIQVTAAQGTNLFRHSRITDTKKTVSFTNVTTNSSTYVFNNCINLKTIRTIAVEEKQQFTGWFDNCNSLENITFAGKIANDIIFAGKIGANNWYCPLTKESITSIVNHLSDSATGKSVTFAKEAVNNAFGINVDDASTFPEGSEFYNLRNSKANWAFNYLKQE